MSEKRKVGRPRKENAEPLQFIVTRVSKEEHERIKAKAEAERVSMAEYIRRKILEP